MSPSNPWHLHQMAIFADCHKAHRYQFVGFLAGRTNGVNSLLFFCISPFLHYPAVRTKKPGGESYVGHRIPECPCTWKRRPRGDRRPLKFLHAEHTLQSRQSEIWLPVDLPLRYIHGYKRLSAKIIDSANTKWRNCLTSPNFSVNSH